MQNKSETPPEENKIGACGDYFVPEGVNIAINAELPPSTQFTAGNHLWGALRQFPNTNKFVQFNDGTSNTILIAECAGREDVWRGRGVTLAKADKSDPNCARARGGAWATNDNPYEIGQRKEWCTNANSIPGTMQINNSNEWGHLYYSFHSRGAHFCMGDGSVRFISESIPLYSLACLTTRAGGDVGSGD
jgi:prepilin-type processing-associated H-X9-DG protein